MTPAGAHRAGEGATAVVAREDGVPLRRRAARRRRRELSGRTVKAALAGIPAFGKLLYGLMRDPRVSRLDRLLFGAALAYVFSPVDILPNRIPFLGRLDDLVLLTLALYRLLYRTDEEVLLEHWEGAVDSLVAIEGLLDRMVGLLPWWARRAVQAG